MVKYPRTCPLFFCDDCGKYTESFMAHLGFNRCAANPPARLPADHWEASQPTLLDALADQ